MCSFCVLVYVVSLELCRSLCLFVLCFVFLEICRSLRLYVFVQLSPAIASLGSEHLYGSEYCDGYRRPACDDQGKC